MPRARLRPNTLRAGWRRQPSSEQAGEEDVGQQRSAQQQADHGKPSHQGKVGHEPDEWCKAIEMAVRVVRRPVG
jgi:hypothetical protein